MAGYGEVNEYRNMWMGWPKWVKVGQMGPGRLGLVQVGSAKCSKMGLSMSGWVQFSLVKSKGL